jgi:hypothetical protein
MIPLELSLGILGFKPFVPTTKLEIHMFATQFWMRATERAVKSAAQFGLFAWGTTAFTSVGNVINILPATGLAMGFGLGLSYLTSIATANIGEKGQPSMIKLVDTPEPGVPNE